MRTDSAQKVGLYVDAANITRNGGYGMRFDILRDFACRDNGTPVRLNAYVAYDEERARTDRDYKDRTLNFYSILRDYGFKVIEKKVSWYVDEAGNRYGKANADLDMAVDALLQSENLDRVLLATGDGDFIQVVRALRERLVSAQARGRLLHVGLPHPRPSAYKQREQQQMGRGRRQGQGRLLYLLSRKELWLYEVPRPHRHRAMDNRLKKERVALQHGLYPRLCLQRHG